MLDYRPRLGARCFTFPATQAFREDHNHKITKTLFQAFCQQQHRPLEAQSVLDYPPLSRGTQFQFHAT